MAGRARARARDGQRRAPAGSACWRSARSARSCSRSLWRLVRGARGPGGVRARPAASVALALPVAIAVWAPAARSQRAGRAGPERRRACSLPPPRHRDGRLASAVWRRLPARAVPRAASSGTLLAVRAGSDGLVTVGLTAPRRPAASKGLLHVMLRGVPLENGGVQMTAQQRELRPEPGARRATRAGSSSLEGPAPRRRRAERPGRTRST